MVFIPTDDGQWVSEEFERLARIIQDYDSYLVLMWIPPDKRTREDKEPYIVVDTRTDSPVLYASELDTPTDILERLVVSDNERGNVLKRIEARELADRILKQREFIDQLEEAHDKANFLFNTPLHYAKMDGVKYDSDRFRYHNSGKKKVRRRVGSSGN